jgi:tetratricopeptide (TPR) repeat protein
MLSSCFGSTQKSDRVIDTMLEGHDLFEKGRYEEAIEKYAGVISIDNNYDNAYLNRGNAYYNLKRYDLAFSDFTKTIELNPTSSLAFSNRGAVYIQLEDYDKAINDFSSAININPDSDAHYFRRAYAYYLKKEYDKSENDIENTLSINQNNDDAKDLKRIILAQNIHININPYENDRSSLTERFEYKETTLLDLQLWENSGGYGIFRGKSTVQFSLEAGTYYTFKDLDGRGLTDFTITKNWPKMNYGQKVIIYFTINADGYGYLAPRQRIIDKIEY